MSHVLLLINEVAHIRELSRVVELLLHRSDLRPVVFLEDRLKHFGPPEPFVTLGVEVLTSDRLMGGDGRVALGQPGDPARRRRARWVFGIAGLLATFLPDRIGRIRTGYYYIKLNRDLMLRRAAVCQAVLSQRDYGWLVLSEDNVELDTAVWIAVARRLGIRTLIVPYTISNVAEFAESYVWHPPYQVAANRANRLAAALFPQWVLRYKGRQLLRTTYGRVFATELLGLTPPNPWLLNSGFVDAIATESAAMHDYYVAGGIPAQQLVITGSLADDVLADAARDAPQRRRALLEKLGLPMEKPVLVCALPPDQNTYDRPGCEFTGFDDLIGFWGSCLAAVEGWNVIVRPHPKTAPDRLSALRRHGVTISYEDTATLIPLCDLYVASVSATIRWAIACGKPVVNYDVYQYGFKDYQKVRGVRRVETREEFKRVLQVMTTDEAERAALAAQQERDAPRWGQLDGRAGERLLALLRQGGVNTLQADSPLQAAAAS
jgi:hypothetical protein